MTARTRWAAVSALLFLLLISTSAFALFDKPIIIISGGNGSGITNETDPVFRAVNTSLWQDANYVSSGATFERKIFNPTGSQYLAFSRNTSSTKQEVITSATSGIYHRYIDLINFRIVRLTQTSSFDGTTIAGQDTANPSGWANLTIISNNLISTANIIAPYIITNGSNISDVCLSNGSNCATTGISQAQLDALNVSKLNITDQRYNDTTAISLKASPGTCAAGTVVQNTTTNGVECVLMTASSSGITNGTDATLRNLNVSNLSTYNITIKYNESQYVNFVNVPLTPVTTSYENTGGRGDRTAIITVTSTYSIAGTASQYVNGKNGTVFDNLYLYTDATPSGKYMRFDFGTPKIVQEARWFQDITTSHSNIKWQGSNDASSWTDIGTTFRLGGATQQLHTQLNGNTNAYRYYQFISTDNTYPISNAAYTYEIDFKIGVSSTAANYLNSIADNKPVSFVINNSLTVNGTVTAQSFNGNVPASNIINASWIPYTGATTQVNLNNQNLTNVKMLKAGTTADSFAGTYPQSAFIYKDQNTVPSQNTAASLTQMLVTTSNTSLQTIGQYMSIATNYNNANHGVLTGLGLQFTHFGNGNVTDGRGVLALVQNVGGGRIDNAYVNNAYVQSSAGNITNAYLYMATSPVVYTTGTIKNLYGLFIQPMNLTNVSNAWGIYQQGTTDINYIAGRMNMGAGTYGQSVTLNMSNTTGGVCRQTFDDGVMVSFTGCN